VWRGKGSGPHLRGNDGALDTFRTTSTATMIGVQRILPALLVTACLWPLPAAATWLPDTAFAPPRCAAVMSIAGPTRVCIAAATYDRDVCRAIALLAAEYRLPEGYLARLLWRESRFDPGAVSPAGAQGIAQFMPGTARLRGLGNAFAPADALVRAAEYLRFLADKFGNLGLAAAAYNAGEARIAGWQAEGGSLAGETRRYVAAITGSSVEDWQAGKAGEPDFTLQPQTPFVDACIHMASARPMPALPEEESAWRPWGVLIAQAFSSNAAMAMFRREKARFAAIFGDETPLVLSVHNPNFGRRLRQSVQLGRDSRKEAETLCNKLIAAGGSCVVVKN
jgi:hypothetical protein